LRLQLTPAFAMHDPHEIRILKMRGVQLVLQLLVLRSQVLQLFSIFARSQHADEDQEGKRKHDEELAGTIVEHRGGHLRWLKCGPRCGHVILSALKQCSPRLCQSDGVSCPTGRDFLSEDINKPVNKHWHESKTLVIRFVPVNLDVRLWLQGHCPRDQIVKAAFESEKLESKAIISDGALCGS